MASSGALRVGRTRRAAVSALVAAACLSWSIAARAEDEIRIAAAAINVAHSAVALAAAKPDVFGRHGIKVTVNDLRGASPNCIAALISEAADLCQVGTTTGTDAIAEGADLVAVAVLTGPVAEIVLSKQAADRLSVKADGPIADRVAAMKGLNIVTSAPGSANYTILDSLMGTVGSSISDIRYRTLADVPAMIEAIRNQQIDGAFWVIGSLAPVIKDGTGVRWISLARGDVEQYLGLPFTSVFARRGWAEKNPDLVKRVHDAYADAVAELKNDPQASSELIRKKFFPDLAPDLWNDGYEQGRLSFLDGARVTAQSWQAFLDLQKKTSGKDYTAAAFDRAVLPTARDQ
ncbi:MAG: ABC transporter substrate-binding protein [Rhizobiaceae bacterium]